MSSAKPTRWPRRTSQSASASYLALRDLLDAVALGGTLLFASHDVADLSQRPEQG